MKDLAVSYHDVVLSSTHITMLLPGSCGMLHDTAAGSRDTHLAPVKTDTLLCPIKIQA